YGKASQGEADDLYVKTPATWIYHPRTSASVTDTRALANGTCLLTTAEGERWLVAGEGEQPCRGSAEAATFPGPEPLAGTLDVGPPLRFLGRSGTVYEAETPLGPFVAAHAPQTPLRVVTTAGTAAIGLAADGALYVLTRTGW